MHLWCILHINAAHQFKCEILLGKAISTLRAKILANILLCAGAAFLISGFYVAFIMFGHHRVFHFNIVVNYVWFLGLIVHYELTHH